jgi:hypothetical protein
MPVSTFALRLNLGAVCVTGWYASVVIGSPCAWSYLP